MESTLTGPILYLLIAWGIITAIFLILLIWRSLLESHEDDQIFIDASQNHMAREQQELVAKINTLSRPIMTSGVTAGVLLLLIAGMWLYEGLKHFYALQVNCLALKVRRRLQAVAARTVQLKCGRALSASDCPS